MAGRVRIRSGEQAGDVPLVLVAAVLGPLLIAGVLVALAIDRRGGEDHQPSLGDRTRTTPTVPAMSAAAREWQDQVDQAFTPLTDRLADLITQATKWSEGELPAETFTADLDGMRPQFEQARDQVAAVEPFPDVPAARDVYRESAALYLEVLRLYGVAASAEEAPLQTQLELSARRLRTLADKVYDRARRMVDPTHEADPPGSDVEIRRPPEVPNWERDGLAAGPPLAEVPPPPDETPSLREQTRPEEPEAEWLARVAGAGIPSPKQLAESISAGDAGRLRSLATTFDQVSAAVWGAPDPAGQRERTALFSLSLLVHEEAARLGQAATMLRGFDAATRLTAVASRLTLVGERLQEPGLRGERSGISPALLSDTGP